MLFYEQNFKIYMGLCHTETVRVAFSSKWWYDKWWSDCVSAISAYFLICWSVKMITLLACQQASNQYFHVKLLIFITHH